MLLITQSHREKNMCMHLTYNTIYTTNINILRKLLPKSSLNCITITLFLNWVYKREVLVVTWRSEFLFILLKDVLFWVNERQFYVCFSVGGRGKDGAPIITFPEFSGFNDLSDEDFINVVTYLTSIPRWPLLYHIPPFFTWQCSKCQNVVLL